MMNENLSFNSNKSEKSNEVLYWIWLQKCLGFASVRVSFFLKDLFSIESFYKEVKNNYFSSNFFSKKEIENFKVFSLEDACRIFDDCQKKEINIIHLKSIYYPKLLRFISNPPCVIYTRGDFGLLNSDLMIAIVGSRAATYYGITLAFEFASQIVNEDAVVVSGGALGIDTAAHKGALSINGKTIAVLPCGINFPYLKTNENLRKKISEVGLLISEYPPFHEMKNYHFHSRNRIIAGLSLGTIVIEAGKRSGAIITANLAIEQNREVFVAPVLVENPLSEGIFNLIADGAKAVENGKAVVEYFKFNKVQNSLFSLFNNKKNKFNINTKIEHSINSEFIKNENIKKEIKHILENQSNEIKLIFDIIKDKKNGIHIEEIKKLSDLNVNLILSSITKMEILGLIKKMPGKIFKISE